MLNNENVIELVEPVKIEVCVFEGSFEVDLTDFDFDTMTIDGFKLSNVEIDNEIEIYDEEDGIDVL